MAAVFLRTLRNTRLLLVSLGIGSIFFVLAFYSAKSGTTYQQWLPSDLIIADVMKSLHNTPDTAPAMEEWTDSNVLSVKVKTPNHVTTANNTDISQARKLKPEESIADWKTLDMSEKFDCGKQCQNKIQEIRQRGVANACALASNIQRPLLWDANGHLRADQMRRLDHLFPIEKTKTIYCSVPKDGCSEWKRMILLVVGYNPEDYLINIHPYFDSKFKALSTYNTTEAEEILRTYKKFLFVREPFQRMLSLFIDKALEQHDLPFNESQFKQFLKFILEKDVTPGPEENRYSEHWALASFLCLPCDIQYSFIGRLETSKRDTNYVFENLFHMDKTSLSKSKKISHNTDPKIKEHYMKQANVSMLRNIYQKYQLDYTMFTYSFPNVMSVTKQSNSSEL